MDSRITLIGAGLALACAAGPAGAALQPRDLDGNTASIEAYYDTELDLTWLADANYAKTTAYRETGDMNWSEAMAWAQNLSFSDGTKLYDNWRLPAISPVNGVSFDYRSSLNGSTDRAYNVSAPGSVYAGSKGSELAYLFYNTLGNRSICRPETSTYGCDGPQPGWGQLNSGPFINVRGTDMYWIGAAYLPTPGEAWDFDFWGGAQSSNIQGARLYAWAVSDGDVAAVPEAGRGLTLAAGLALLAWFLRRRPLRA